MLVAIAAIMARTTCAASAADTTGIYVIVHLAEFADAAAAWGEHRAAQGWSVQPISLHDAPRDESARRQFIRSEIRKEHRARREAHTPFMVLLLGDVGNGTDPRIPTWRFDQADTSLQSRHDKTYVTDHIYQLADDADDLADFPLGRVPVATNEQALEVLAKIQRYESSPPHSSALHVAYVAGEGRFGPADAILERLFHLMVEQIVPPEFEVSALYAKPCSPYCPPPSRLGEAVLEQLSRGSLLFNYVGHGSAHSFDRLRIGEKRFDTLTVQSLDSLPDCRGQLPIALLTCCDSGWFDLPDGQQSLAEAMLLHPEGPVAVIAGSRNTHPYANAILQKNISVNLLQRRLPLLGEVECRSVNELLQHDAIDEQLDRLARPIAAIGRWPSALPVLRTMHTKLYNLLGDPALRIQHPLELIEELIVDSSFVAGAVRGIDTGEVVLSFLTLRADCAASAQLLPCDADASDAAELEPVASHNFPLINDRVLLRLTAPIINGRFRVELPAGIPQRAAAVTVFATGRDKDGRNSMTGGGRDLPQRSPAR